MHVHKPGNLCKHLCVHAQILLNCIIQAFVCARADTFELHIIQTVGIILYALFACVRKSSGMSLACRHCHGRDEFPVRDNNKMPLLECGGGRAGTASSSSYMECLVYGLASSDGGEAETFQLQRVLEWVEEKATGCCFTVHENVNEQEEESPAVPMPGVAVWCSVCRRMSVISYTYHRNLRKDKDGVPDHAIATQSAYYTKMCISAEMWMKMLEMQAPVLQRQTLHLAAVDP